MRLDTEFPLGIALADINRQTGILFGGQAIHRLYKKMVEFKLDKMTFDGKPAF